MWHVFHRYNQLAKDNLAPALKCPDCQNNLITRIKEGSDELKLWCYQCDTYITPGLEMYHRIKAVVRKHN